MTRCRGKTREGGQCKMPAAEGDKRCLAHKLKTLPRELVAMIFEYIKELDTLQQYAGIYPEILPLYFQRKQERGTEIATQLFQKYRNNPRHIPDKVEILFGKIESRNRQSIDKVIFQLLFANDWWRIDEKLFCSSWNYLNSLFPEKYSEMGDVILSREMIRCIFNGKLSAEMKKKITVLLTSMGEGVTFSTSHQMANLLFLLKAVFQLRTNNEHLFYWRRLPNLSRLVYEICEIKPWGKALFLDSALELVE